MRKNKLSQSIAIIFIVMFVLCVSVCLYFNLKDATPETTATILTEETIEYSVETQKTYTLKEFYDGHFKLISYKKFNTKEEVEIEANLVSNYINYLNELCANSKFDGTAEYVADEINNVEYILDLYNNDIIRFEEIEAENERWSKKAAEYPVATKVWLYLKNELGWNDYVCAGAIGNMMAECGGHTLNLNPYASMGIDNNIGYYGICQWSEGYGIVGQDLDAQLALLKSTVPATFNTQWAANLYKDGFNYRQFVALEDYGEAAVAFAKVYERCASQYVELRRGLAEIAYNYFTS